MINQRLQEPRGKGPRQQLVNDPVTPKPARPRPPIIISSPVKLRIELGAGQVAPETTGADPHARHVGMAVPRRGEGVGHGRREARRRVRLGRVVHDRDEGQLRRHGGWAQREDVNGR